ncbi:MAG: TerC family protein, partial [Limisphaerales bacterium]
MLALIHFTPWQWLGFVCLVLLLLAVDLGWAHRRPHVVNYREALVWTGVWVCLALSFALALRTFRGPRESLQFLTGYIIEWSLSLDNMFVIALIFSYFQVPLKQQHRVLFWGILGALAMRGLMIGVGAALISWLHWVLYLLGLLILYSGLRMLFARAQIDPEKNRVIRLVRKFYPVAPHFQGERFTTRWQGRL